MARGTVHSTVHGPRRTIYSYHESSGGTKYSAMHGCSGGGPLLGGATYRL